MTIKVFWQDPYLTELKSTITSIVGDQIMLDRTIFFAQSGGQESDTGTINQQVVIAAQKQATDIIYQVENAQHFTLGDEVISRINWSRRYHLMRCHFAAEMVLELVIHKFKSIEKIGAHIAEQKARIDFLFDGNIAAIFPEIESNIADIIAANLVIETGFSDESAERRYWKIDGFAQVPCGGTHVKNTAEIGSVKLKRKNIGKGKERIEIFID